MGEAEVIGTVGEAGMTGVVAAGEGLDVDGVTEPLLLDGLVGAAGVGVKVCGLDPEGVGLAGVDVPGVVGGELAGAGLAGTGVAGAEEPGVAGVGVAGMLLAGVGVAEVGVTGMGVAEVAAPEVGIAGDAPGVVGFVGVNIKAWGVPAGLPTGVAAGVLTGEGATVGAVDGEGVASGVAAGLRLGIAGGVPAKPGCRLIAPGVADLGELDGDGPRKIVPVVVDAGVLPGIGEVVGVGVAAGDSSGTGGRGISGVGTWLRCTTGDCGLAGVLCEGVTEEALLGDAAGDGLETDWPTGEGIDVGLGAAGEAGVMGEPMELGAAGEATTGLLVGVWETAGLTGTDGAATGVLSAGTPGHLQHRVKLHSPANKLANNSNIGIHNWSFRHH